MTRFAQLQNGDNTLEAWSQFGGGLPCSLKFLDNTDLTCHPHCIPSPREIPKSLERCHRIPRAFHSHCHLTPTSSCLCADFSFSLWLSWQFICLDSAGIQSPLWFPTHTTTKTHINTPRYRQRATDTDTNSQTEAHKNGYPSTDWPMLYKLRNVHRHTQTHRHTHMHAQSGTCTDTHMLRYTYTHAQSGTCTDTHQTWACGRLYKGLEKVFNAHNL